MKRLCNVKWVLCNVFLLCAILFTRYAAFGQNVSSAELIANAAQYDGQTVSFRGEAIGDIMVRGDYAWINVLEGDNAVGIWSRKELAKDILFTGDYKTKGDLVEITGVFRRVCPEHGGDMDIHAHNIRKVASGRHLGQRVTQQKITILFFLLGALALVWILIRLKIR